MIYKEKLRRLFQNTYTETNKNHDEAVIAFENFCNINRCNIPIMVNYDTHSDVYLNMKQISPNIANWVNFCFSKLGVIEYYWIIPHYITKNEQYKKVFETNPNLHKDTFQNGAMRAFGNLDDVLKQDFILDKKNSEIMTPKKLDIINEKNKKYNLPLITCFSDDFTPISIYIVPFDKISVLKGKEIALSIDADSFCNSGHDTISAINNIDISSEEIKKEFELFINELYDNEVIVSTASLTRSPAYFPSKFEPEINEFFSDCKSVSTFKKGVKHEEFAQV